MVTRTREDVAALLEPFMAERNAGFWPTDGWLNLIVTIHERLAGNPNYRVVQIKEKFGGLVYAADGLTPDEREFVRDMEQMSARVCQQCGHEGDDVRIRQRGWYATLCAGCDTQPEPTRGYRLPQT